MKTILRFFVFLNFLIFTSGYTQIRVTTNARDQSETSIAINPGNDKNLVGGSNDFSQGGGFGTSRCAYYYSNDGGPSWPTKGLLTLPTGFTLQADPSVAFDRNNNVFYGNTAYNEDATLFRPRARWGSIFVYKSTNGGNTWNSVPTTVVSHLSDPFIHADKPYLTVDAISGSYSGRIYISWTTFYNRLNQTGNDLLMDSSKIHLSYSTDGGASFLTPPKVLASESNIVPPDYPVVNYYMLPTTTSTAQFVQDDPYVQGSIPAVGPDGSVYVAWFRVLPSTNVNIEIRKSTDGGNSFGSTKLIATVQPSSLIIGTFRRAPYPIVVVDPNNASRVFIAWSSQSSFYENVYCSRSTDGGTTWSSPVQVNSNDFQYTFFPWMTIDPTGRIFITFHKGTTSFNTYFSESLNNGQTFGSNILVSDSSSNADNGTWFFDYDGAVSTVGRLHPMWTDQRRTNEDIYTARVNRPPTSNSSTATAGNGQRKLAQDLNGSYHLVFETNQEIWYARKTNTDIEWNNYQRLSSGIGGGNSSPCIAERDGKIYVVWQRQYMGTHNIHFRSYVSGSWGSVQTLATSVGANPPLPVIISPATSKLMAVYRTSSNFYYRVSNNDGSSWTAATAVPWPGANDSSPTLAPTTTYWGNGTRSCLVYAYNSGSTYTIYYQYYRNGPDSTEGWNLTRMNLSAIVPGSYNSHKQPSIAPSGTSGDKRLHVVWEARSGTSGNYYVIIHRKATDWVTWPNVYSATYYEQQQQPSITGLANDTAELLFKYYTQNQIYKMHYNGSSWGSPVFVGDGTNPSVSVGNTTAKYVWTYGYTSPYQIKISSETLSKTVPLTVAYHRSIAVIDTASGAYLELRINKLSVKTRTGAEFTIPFSTAQEDTATLTPANAFANLSSQTVLLPADAESLVVSCLISGQGLSAVKRSAGAVAADFILAGKDGAKLGLPALRATSENLAETKVVLAAPISVFAGSEISLRTQVAGIANKAPLIASLGHIYEFVEAPLPKILDGTIAAATPKDFALTVYPNPFNPSTQIHFTMKDAGMAALRIFNLQGQLIRDLLHEYRVVGEHRVPWDGRDDRGIMAASGVYFIRFEAGNEVKVSKVMLVR